MGGILQESKVWCVSDARSIREGGREYAETRIRLMETRDTAEEIKSAMRKNGFAAINPTTLRCTTLKDLFAEMAREENFGKDRTKFSILCNKTNQWFTTGD